MAYNIFWAKHINKADISEIGGKVILT
ncbi:hypothetical protein LCGC14_2719320, partial [marine sediment metagenome]